MAQPFTTSSVRLASAIAVVRAARSEFQSLDVFEMITVTLARSSNERSVDYGLSVDSFIKYSRLFYSQRNISSR